MNGDVLGRKAMVLYFDGEEFKGREEIFCSIASVLSDAYNNWKSLKEISERAAARDQSAVGGQGHGIIKCKCKGECSNAKCPCKKAGRLCTSACHKGNDKCVNHE